MNKPVTIYLSYCDIYAGSQKMFQEKTPSTENISDQVALTPGQGQKTEDVEVIDQPTRGQQIAQLITETQRSSDISTFYIQAVAAKVGMHPTDLKVLSLLMRKGPLSAGRIAELTGLTTGAITFMLDRLEKTSYVRRVR